MFRGDSNGVIKHDICHRKGGPGRIRVNFTGDSPAASSGTKALLGSDAREHNSVYSSQPPAHEPADEPEPPWDSTRAEALRSPGVHTRRGHTHAHLRSLPAFSSSSCLLLAMVLRICNKNLYNIIKLFKFCSEILKEEKLKPCIFMGNC